MVTDYRVEPHLYFTIKIIYVKVMVFIIVQCHEIAKILRDYCNCVVTRVTIFDVTRT